MGHQWETELVHGGIRPGGGKWENRLERCAVCSARRQRRDHVGRRGGNCRTI